MKNLIDDVIVGLFAAAIVGGVTLLISLTRDMTLRRRYPIAGIYASEYIDHDGDHEISVKATAVLEQRGRHMWGITTDLSDGRRWRMDGRVDDGGRIFGTYGADDPHDEGLGGFFLELNRDGGLEGMWTGYDSVNKAVQAGRYHFWPLRAAVVEQMMSSDLDRALAVLGQSLGRRYITREGLAGYANGDEGKAGFVCHGPGGTLQGAVTVEVAGTFESLLALLPQDAESTFRDLMPELEFHRIGLLKSVATAPDSRSHGVGTRLVAAGVEWLWGEGSTCVLTIGWTDAEGCHIAGVAEGLGFRQIAAVPHFWTKDSQIFAYSCPSCGMPCNCEARIFVTTRENSANGQVNSGASKSRSTRDIVGNIGQ